jgi:hypothetical protein
MLTQLVLKIDQEMAKLRQSKDNNSLVINRCWNVIRVMADDENFAEKYSEMI